MRVTGCKTPSNRAAKRINSEGERIIEKAQEEAERIVGRAQEQAADQAGVSYLAKTGQSARGFQSVTVHAPTCLVAGSATTVAMVKGERAGLDWLDALGLAYLCVTADGRVAERFGDKIQGHSRTS